MKSIALMVLLALAAHAPLGAAKSVAGQLGKPEDVALAPDGKRGFGLGLTPKSLSSLLRSKTEDDRAFFAELSELATSTRVLLLNVRQLYAARGYFKFLPGSVGDDLALLHLGYAKCYDAPARELAAGDPRAKALASMLVDTRFNARRELVLRAVVAVADLERARAVFGATVTGFVSLNAAELEHIAARADLAAAELRALRSDLEALKPTPEEQRESPEELALAKQFQDIAHESNAETRAQDLQSALDARRALEARMQQLLFSERAEPNLTSLRQWRERVLKAAGDIRTKVLELLPDTPEGDKPRPEIARMKKTERINQAYALAIEGLGSDPLDAELAWAAGHARQFSWPGQDGVLYFDRFLALSGIRTSDPRPGNGRKLSVREQEAFNAVVAFRH